MAAAAPVKTRRGGQRGDNVPTEDDDNGQHTQQSKRSWEERGRWWVANAIPTTKVSYFSAGLHPPPSDEGGDDG